MSIHFAYIMLFSNFCAACENSEFCYYIFSDNFFYFSWEKHSICKSYTIYKLQNALYEKPAKQVYTLPLFCIIVLRDTQKCVLHAKYIGRLTVFWDYQGLVNTESGGPDAHKQKQNVTRDTYFNTLMHLRHAILSNGWRLLSQEVVLINDNTHPHRTQLIQTLL